MVLLVIFAGSAGLGVAACSSSPMLGRNCGAAMYSPPGLAIPAPDATGVPADIGAIYVGQDVTHGKFYLQAAGAASAFPVGPVSAVPSPAPSALPTYDPVSYFSKVTIPTLNPATRYTMTYVSPDGSQPCPEQIDGTVGSFTTQ